MIFGCFVGRFVSIRGGSLFIERKVRVFPMKKVEKNEDWNETSKVRNYFV